jgi:hypothetical protein
VKKCLPYLGSDELRENKCEIPVFSAYAGIFGDRSRSRLSPDPAEAGKFPDASEKFPAPAKKFPARRRREFCRQTLDFAGSQIAQFAEKAPKLRNCLLFSLLAGKPQPETGPISTASATTQSCANPVS